MDLGHLIGHLVEFDTDHQGGRSGNREEYRRLVGRAFGLDLMILFRVDLVQYWKIARAVFFLLRFLRRPMDLRLYLIRNCCSKRENGLEVIAVGCHFNYLHKLCNVYAQSYTIPFPFPLFNCHPNISANPVSRSPKLFPPSHPYPRPMQPSERHLINTYPPTIRSVPKKLLLHFAKMPKISGGRINILLCATTVRFMV